MFRGQIIHGDGIGKMTGYPTANLDISAEAVCLDDGVYAAWVTLDKNKHSAALVIQKSVGKVEAHVLDLVANDLYGQEMQVEPVERVSGIEMLTGDDLINKITQDIRAVRDVLGV